MGTLERRKRERERKMGDIIDAARSLFFQNGYESTSMDSVAEKVELSKGSLYLHFSTKDELYYAVAKEGMSIVREMFRQASSTKGSGLERLEVIGRAYIEFWTKYPEYRRLLHDTRLGTTPVDSGPQGKEFAAIASEVNELMVQVVRSGVEDGSIRHDVVPELFVFCASSMVEGILARTERHGWAGRGESFREEALNYANALWKEAVAAHAPATKPFVKGK